MAFLLPIIGLIGAKFNFSANAAESIVTDAINVAITYSQTCSAKLKNTQQISLTGCTITAKNINIDNVGVGIIKCAQDVSNTANIQQVVEQALKQSATAASQQLGLGLKADIAVSLSKVTAALSQSIVENFTQTCTSQFVNNQSFICNGSQITLSEGINVTNYQNTLTSCTFKAVSQTQAYSQLQQIISQSSVAEEQSFFSFTVVAGLVIVAVISIIATGYARKNTMNGYSGGVSGSKVSNSTSWLIIGIVAFICIILIIYALLASSSGWWPFLPKTTPATGTGFQTN